MIRSMFSAVSGLLNNQQRMDVIGNNIANVNTVGFKVSDATFAESQLQSERSATADQPIGLAVGLGSRLVGTTTSFTQGAFQRTDVPSDLAINGEGFYSVGTTTAAGGNEFLTRAGNFVIDSSGYFRTPDGLYLKGQMGTGTTANITAAVAAGAAGTAGTFPTTAVFVPQQIGGVGVANYSVGLDGVISAVDTAGATLDVGRILLSHFRNENGLRREGNNLYTNSNAAGHIAADPPNSAFLATSIQSGALEMSNVDMADQFSHMIITQRGFDANARTISTSDEMLQTVMNLKR
ncbi:MAG: flagellar hook-basal body complex protein [Verrucomicrobiota bacterium]